MLDIVTFANQSKDSLQPCPEVADISNTVPEPPLDLLYCSEARSARPSSSQSSAGLLEDLKSDLLPSRRRWARANSFSSIISLISCLSSANLSRSLLSTTKTMAPVFLALLSYIVKMWLINSTPVFRHLALGINKTCT